MTKIAFSKMALTGKIPVGDPLWPKFNASFDNLDIEAMEIVNLIYMGHPFTTWHKDHWRHSKNYQLGQHIGLDFDTEDERSTLSYLAKDKFVKKYASLVYTTPSHTPEAPRARVLFLLDTPIQQSKNYVLSATSLLWLFGSGDRQCKDAVRFFYGSANCDVEYIGNTLPLDVVMSLIKQYQATGNAVKKHHESGKYSAPVEQKKVEEALKHIPAMGIDYGEWVSVLMALHAEFGDSGLPLAESWAQGVGDEVQKKWRGFSKKGNGSGAVTIASLFKLAMNHGWQGNKIAV